VRGGGDEVKTYILVHGQVGTAVRVAREASTIDGVLSADPVTGPYDVVVQAEARNLEDASRDVVAKIQAIPEVTKTLTCVVTPLGYIWDELLECAYAGR
jgi:DNA-binding Lrp family transcriptional regulator